MTIFDNESVEQTAQILSVNRYDVIRAITIAGAYERILRSNKDKHKNEREDRIRQQVREQQMQKHPEWCWCDAEHNPDLDTVIRQEKTWCPVYVSPDCEMGAPVYKCAACGGEYRITLMWA